MSRRKRFIIQCHSNSTLFHIREILGRSVELIVANDVATLEAALRLYQQIGALIVEKKPNTKLPEQSLLCARERLPDMPRIALVDFEAMIDAHMALASGLVTRLVFTPFTSAELMSAVNADVASTEPACVPMPNRRLQAG